MGVLLQMDVQLARPVREAMARRSPQPHALLAYYYDTTLSAGSGLTALLPKRCRQRHCLPCEVEGMGAHCAAVEGPCSGYEGGFRVAWPSHGQLSGGP